MADVTLDQIQYLTGYETTDAVRMALKRAGVKACGFAVGTSTWPPKKIYPADKVWEVFGTRILQRADADAGVKDYCWKVFHEQICVAVNGAAASKVYADRLNQSE